MNYRTQTIKQLTNEATTLENDDLIPVYQSGETKKISARNFFKNHSNPVDVVEKGNLHAVTSNAVADAIGGKKIKFISGTYTIINGYITIDPQMTTENYLVMTQNLYNSEAPRNFSLTTQIISKNKFYVYVTKSDGTSFNNVSINLLLMIIY